MRNEGSRRKMARKAKSLGDREGIRGEREREIAGDASGEEEWLFPGCERSFP